MKPQVGMIRTAVNKPEYEDGYAAKLVKYIPAEILAGFIPLVALADRVGADFWVWLTIGIGALGVVGYSRWQATDVLWNKLQAAHGPAAPVADRWRSRQMKREFERMQPYAYFYVLAVIAFGAWALATASPVRQVVGLDATESEFIVAAVTLLLPLADATLKHFWEWDHTPFHAQSPLPHH